MRDRFEVLIGSPFSGPKMSAVAVCTVGLGREEIFHKPEDNDIAHLEAGLSRQQYLIAGYDRQYPLAIGWQAVIA